MVTVYKIIIAVAITLIPICHSIDNICCNEKVAHLRNGTREWCMACKCRVWLEKHNNCMICPSCHIGWGQSKKCGYGRGIGVRCVICDPDKHLFSDSFEADTCKRSYQCRRFNRVYAKLGTSKSDAVCGDCLKYYYYPSYMRNSSTIRRCDHCRLFEHESRDEPQCNLYWRDYDKAKSQPVNSFILTSKTHISLDYAWVNPEIPDQFRVQWLQFVLQLFTTGEKSECIVGVVFNCRSCERRYSPKIRDSIEASLHTCKVRETVNYDDQDTHHTYNSTVDLIPYTEYRATVRPVNIDGIGQKSTLVNRTNEWYPGKMYPPIIYNIQESQFEASWTPPANPNGIILEYRFSYYPQEHPTAVTAIYIPGGQTTVVVKGLLPCKVYNSSISARTRVGFGIESPEQSTTLLTNTPGIPQELRLSNTSSTSLNASWEEPANQTCPISYNVLLYDVDAGCNLKQNETVEQDTAELSFEGLEKYRKYEVHVKAFTSKSPGKTAKQQRMTSEDIPGPIQNLKVYLDCVKNTVYSNITWDKPYSNETNGILHKYIIIITEEGSKEESRTELAPEIRHHYVELGKIQSIQNINISVLAVTGAGPANLDDVQSYIQENHCITETISKVGLIFGAISTIGLVIAMGLLMYYRVEVCKAIKKEDKKARTEAHADEEAIPLEGMKECENDDANASEDANGTKENVETALSNGGRNARRRHRSFSEKVDSENHKNTESQKDEMPQTDDVPKSGIEPFSSKSTRNKKGLKLTVPTKRNSIESKVDRQTPPISPHVRHQLLETTKMGALPESPHNEHIHNNNSVQADEESLRTNLQSSANNVEGAAQSTISTTQADVGQTVPNTLDASRGVHQVGQQHISNQTNVYIQQKIVYPNRMDGGSTQTYPALCNTDHTFQNSCIENDPKDVQEFEEALEKVEESGLLLRDLSHDARQDLSNQLAVRDSFKTLASKFMGDFYIINNIKNCDDLFEYLITQQVKVVDLLKKIDQIKRKDVSKRLIEYIKDITN